MDSGAPTAEIVFPPTRSLTEGNSVTVRGTAEDPEGSEITVVRVNGVDATTSDDFATWQATVALQLGENSLTVETGDIKQNADSEAASAVIERQALWLTPRAAVVDDANHRALVVDSYLDAVIAVDLDTGARTVLSDSSTPDADNPFSVPVDIALDSTNNRALVVDVRFDAVIAVDSQNGQRVVFSK